jgi:hypothetical protein
LPAWRLQRSCGEIGEPFFPINLHTPMLFLRSPPAIAFMILVYICFQSRSCNL